MRSVVNGVLVRLMGSQCGIPEVTVGDAFLLMEQLSTLKITVIPLQHEPLVQFVTPNPETLAKVQEEMGQNDRIVSWLRGELGSSIPDRVLDGV